MPKDGSERARNARRHWLVMILVLAVAAIAAAGALSTLAGRDPPRNGSPATAPEALAIAPAIVWGTAIGHEDRGACTSCHRVVSPAGAAALPSISALSNLPHEFRGVCNNCHAIEVPWSRRLIPVAGRTGSSDVKLQATVLESRGARGPGSLAIAYATLALMVTLAVWRPRIGAGGFRFSPGTAALVAVAIMFFSGILTADDLISSAVIQWRPLLTLTCIMVMTGVVQEVGIFDRIAREIEARARGRSAGAAFALIFVASVITAALLNNDSAILLLTPLAIALSRRLYPHRPQMTLAFAFAVFLAPGVAPFVISNPMNMIVAEFAGIGFNDYARVMVPISLAGALLTFVVLRVHFRDLLASTRARRVSVEWVSAHPAEGAVIAVVLTAFAAYPLMAALGGPVWVVSLLGALACVLVADRHRITSLRNLGRHVSPDILVFLWGVFLVVVGIGHVGAVDGLASVYQSVPPGGLLELAVVGGVSAAGSALVDNHPMSLLNMMALGVREGGRPLLAALIGGDIGPRLLPIGSLAGLLWIDLLRRAGVRVTAASFARVGTLVLLPTLALSIVMLWLLA